MSRSSTLLSVWNRKGPADRTISGISTSIIRLHSCAQTYSLGLVCSTSKSFLMPKKLGDSLLGTFYQESFPSLLYQKRNGFCTLQLNGQCCKPMIRAKPSIEWEGFVDHVKRVYHQYSCKKAMKIIPSGLDVDAVYLRRDKDREDVQNLIAWATATNSWKRRMHFVLSPCLVHQKS